MKDIVQKKLEAYNLKSAEDELNALKEITQEVALYSLYKVGFFQSVSFLGGTSLRILHGLDRFSEDLDFSTLKPNTEFDLIGLLEKAMLHMNAYGYDLNIDQKDLADKNVQSRFLKDDSIKKVLTFKHMQDTRAKIKIKVEVDTNPPLGSKQVVEYVDFPMDFPVVAHDLPSLFAGKLHALLCRPYPKGRDWYDFLWYISNGVKPNLDFFQNAIWQLGPWSNSKLEVDNEFIKTNLSKKIQTLNWNEVALDVRKFLSSEKAATLELWSAAFFESKVKKL